MPPVKFDDIPKVATEILNDDYQVSGYVFKAKQKASWGGAVLSTQVDLYQDDKVATPAKLAWRLPSPFGLEGVVVDKLELDKSGNLKLEASSDKTYPGLKLEAKSDLADVSKVMVGATYTGLKDAQFKLEAKAVNPQVFTGEATYTRGPVTGGIKLTNAVLAGGLPDFGVRFLNGPVFLSLLAKAASTSGAPPDPKSGNVGVAFNAAASYTVNPTVKLGATYQYGGKANGAYSVGAVCKGLYKAKIAQDNTVSLSVKHSLAKGFTVLAGGKYNLIKGDFSYGLQLSIE